MKKYILPAVAALCAVTIAVSAHAEHHEGDKAEKKGSYFDSIDTDKNGEISKAEFMKKHEERFTETDKDGNGSLSRQETDDAYKAMKDRRKELRMKAKEAKKPSGDAPATPAEPAE